MLLRNNEKGIARRRGGSHILHVSWGARDMGRQMDVATASVGLQGLSKWANGRAPPAEYEWDR